MDIATLKNLIGAALAQSPFQENGAALSSPSITNLLTNQFGSDSLILSGASQASETGTSISVQGQMTTTFLGATNLDALATFTVDTNQNAEVMIVLSGLPPGWVLSTSFPALRGTMFDLFSYGTAQFTLDSTNGTVLPEDFPAQYGLPAYTSAYSQELVPGLSFQATLAQTSEVSGLSILLPGSSWAISGPVEIEDGTPSLVLSSSSGDGISVAGYSIAFSLNLVGAVVTFATGDNIAVSGIQLEASIEKSLSGGRVLNIPVYVRTFSPDFSSVEIVSNLATASAIAFDDITALIDGGSTNGLIPPDFPQLVNIQVQEIRLTYLPTLNTVSMVNATIGFQPGSGQNWSIFDGLIVFDSFSIVFSLLPETASVNVSVGCVTQFCGGTIDASISLPDMYFSFELQDGGPPIDIGAAVRQTTNGTVTMDSVTCTELRVFGTVGDFYRFQATVTDLWSFDIGSTPLQIAEIGMDLTYTPLQANPLAGQIIGTFNVAGVRLYASAQYDSTSNGWVFSGGTQGRESISITSLLADTLALFDLQLPANAPPVTLENLNITFNTATHEVDFLAMSKFTVVGVEFDLGLQISLAQQQTLFMGYLFFGDHGFEVNYQSGSQASIMTGNWQATEDQAALSIADLFAALELNLPALPGESILSLKAASVTYNITTGSLLIAAENLNGDEVLAAFIPGDSGSPTQWVLGLAMGQTFSLSDLPLVGTALSEQESASIGNLEVLASSGPITPQLAAAVASLNPPAGYPAPPLTGTPAAIVLQAQAQFGSQQLPISFPLGGASSPQQSLRSAALTDVAGSDGGQVTSLTTPDGTIWFTVQRSFGPVSIQRIGALFQPETQVLWFEIDATLAFGPLTLNLLGLGLGIPLATFQPQFTLAGLGVSYSNPPLIITGSLVNLAPPGAHYIQFAGGVTISTGDFTVQAFGYYGNAQGFNSMFIFGDLTYDFGGPPAFFVTGVALGFGYNSSLTIPSISQVDTFPFLQVLPKSTAPNPAVFGGSNPSPLNVLTTILSGGWVVEQQGTLWFAAGITFTSFQLVNSQALAVVELGDELVIALIGRSRAQFPKTGSAVYAYIDLDLLLRFAPGDGVFSLQAELAPSSFLLDKDCVLSGGLAFFAWFGSSPYSGNFVLTVGGYHPGFIPPSYYPATPRVGFHWAMDSTITIQGSAYFALTPAVLMVGAGLNATYQSGNLKAWFNAHADVIIRWAPFWIDAPIGILIGAVYKADLLFTTATFSLEVGCNLEFWGPPTGGSVTVEWYVVDFTVAFGSAPGSESAISGWQDVEAMLPNTGSGDAINVLTLSPAAGLIPNGTQPASSTGQQQGAGAPGALPAPCQSAYDSTSWMVRGGQFAFNTGSPIPASTATVGAQYTFPGSPFNVYPLMQQDASWANVSASHAITIQDGTGKDWSYAFTASPVVSNVPASLWGSPPVDKSGQPQVPSASSLLVKNQLTGVSLQVRPPAMGNSSGSVSLNPNLAYDNLELPGALLPISSSAATAGDVPGISSVTISTIADPQQGIASSAVSAARLAIFQGLGALGYAPSTNDSMTDFAAQIGCSLTAEPLLVA